ncbi:MAG: Na+/H+ antiporter NhaC family protein [Pirellulaceae bacterium]
MIDEHLSPWNAIGWICVLPPLLTIALAIITRRVVLSLFIGVLVATTLLLPSPEAQQQAWGDSFTWWRYIVDGGWRLTIHVTETHLWASLANEDHLRVFAFTSILGMQVALIHRSGGMAGIVHYMAPLARTRRGGQVLTWLLGLVIFIDDYANTLLLGSTMRPLADRLRISREKLAFLVDSTAAPVSGLALVSTWVATEISTMEEGFKSAGIDVGSDTFGIFIETIPGRFYILYMLAFVLLCGWLCRDFGSMLAAERSAADAEAAPSSSSHQVANEEATDLHGLTVVHPFNAILPICITVLVAVWLLYRTGMAANADEQLAESGWQAAGQIIGQGNSYLALLYGALAGLVVILGLVWRQGELSAVSIRTSLLQGFLHVLPALVILWLAWTLSELTGKEHMQTGAFLASQIGRLELHPGLMPTIIFVFAGFIAFATGTSWGTMAIVMPISIPMVIQLVSAGGAVPVDPHHPVVIATIASVLAGAIFGDHCSPISDTTILSSRSSDCDHIAHVRTQMPYALTVGSISILCGTLPVGFGVSSWILLPVGLLAMLAVLLVFGRKV